MKTPRIAIVSKCVIKNKTNADELCKSYFTLLIGEDKPSELVLVIRKYILTDKKGLCYQGFIVSKTFKNKALYMQRFSIKTSTLEQAQKLLDINIKYIKK